MRVVCWALIVLIPFSRMYLGVHTPLDVAVSFVIATALVFALKPVMDRSDRKPGILYLMLLGMVVLAVLYILYVECWPFPADMDPANYASGRENGYTLLGAVLGINLVHYLDDQFLRFETQAPPLAQGPQAGAGAAGGAGGQGGPEASAGRPVRHPPGGGCRPVFSGGPGGGLYLADDLRLVHGYSRKIQEDIGARKLWTKKVTSIVAYLSWIGLLIAFVAGDREGAKFHLNQSPGDLAGGNCSGCCDDCSCFGAGW